MAYVITSKCVDCKFTDCVEVCPVDCFYESNNQLVIDPEECIDCMACVDQCPVEAIYADADVPDEEQGSIDFNAKEAERLKEVGEQPIVTKKDPLPTAEDKKKQLGY